MSRLSDASDVDGVGGVLGCVIGDRGRGVLDPSGVLDGVTGSGDEVNEAVLYDAVPGELKE
jgi:hypothetical protein